MTLPVTNARLTAISTAGASEDWDQAAGASTGKWSGDIGVYVLEQWRTMFVVSEGAQQRYKTVTAWIPLNVIPGGQLLSGDLITLTYNGQSTTRRVQDSTPNVLPGHPLQTYQVTLEVVPVETPA